MVLVDTSVWIALYQKNRSNLGQKMWALVAENQAALCGQVWVEFIGGFRREEQRHDYQKSLKAFPFLETTREAYEKAADLLAHHPRLGAGDSIIAATAMISKVPLFTLDRDFDILATQGLDLF